VAAVASVKQDWGGKWAAIVAIGQCVFAWIVVFIIRIIGAVFGMV